MPARPLVRYSYEDYLATPESSTRHEIVEGELFVNPAPLFRHQQVVMNLARALWLATGEGLGEVVGAPVTLRLADDTATEPDLVFIRADRMDIVVDGRITAGVPDLVAEVLSPSNRSYDRNLKRRRYQSAGVPELWILDSEADTLEVWRPHSVVPERPEGEVEWRVGGRAFRLALADIFRR